MKRQAFVALAVCAVVAGCSDRPPPDVLAPKLVASGADAETVQVYVATTRDRLPGRPYAFGAHRNPEVSFASFKISVPPDRPPGRVSWGEGIPDPRTDFITTRQRILTRREFIGLLGSKDVGVFIHGFNQSLQEALLGTAAVGAFLGEQPILFSWPSEGRLSAYLADRDAADFSRDALAETLTELVRTRAAGGRVRVLAHSMGARLMMESLRQLRLQGRSDVIDRLDVVLAAPDIDVDMFRRQIAVIGRTKEPITILVASDDRALAVSSQLSARRQRVGSINLNDPRVRKAVQEAGLRVIDISSIETDSLAHSRFVDLAALYPKLEGAGPAGNPVAGARRVGAFVFDSVGMTFDGIGSILSD